MILETERLLLRPWTEDDAAQLYQYASDPELGPAAGWAPHTDTEDSRRVIREILSKDETYALCLKSQNAAPVGSIGCFTEPFLPEGPEIGYWIGRPFWGQGLVPEAVGRVMEHLFAETDCQRVWCAHFLGNDKSRRVIEKCGFRPEFLRESTWPAIGKTLTEQFYSIRKAEFFAERPPKGAAL